MSISPHQARPQCDLWHLGPKLRGSAAPGLAPWAHGCPASLGKLYLENTIKGCDSCQCVFFCNTGVKASRSVDSCECRNDMYTGNWVKSCQKWGMSLNPTFNLGNPCKGHVKPLLMGWWPSSTIGKQWEIIQNAHVAAVYCSWLWPACNPARASFRSAKTSKDLRKPAWQ